MNTAQHVNILGPEFNRSLILRGLEALPVNF